MKNRFLKKVKIENAYFVINLVGWQWRVLKLYKNPENSIKDRFSRAYCAVASPYTSQTWEYGDNYVHRIPGLLSLLKVEVDNDSRTAH